MGLRAGAYKPRTSPYGFQGHGPEGLRILSEAGRATGLPTFTEVVDTADVPLVAEHADALQIGARNMQNFALLRAVAETGKPILLKRGLSAKIEELLLAAEYLLAAGMTGDPLRARNQTFEPATRTRSISTPFPISAKSHLPILVDPSHGTGIRDLSCQCRWRRRLRADGLAGRGS